MEFVGDVWFRFGSRGVWQFYLFLRELASRGVRVGIDWKPFPGGGEDEAQQVYIGLESPDDRGRFLHAMLGLTHLEGRDPRSGVTVADALAQAGVEGIAPATQTQVQALRAEAEALGVSDVPSLYRHGPVTRVLLNPAAREGDVIARAGSILAMSDDDGIWGLEKP